MGLYALVLVATGVAFSLKKQRDTSDYFLGGRSMPAWAVAISILATAQSAATFIGVPSMSYDADIRYLSSNIGSILAIVVLVRVFIPAFYRHRVFTPYELLETRFGRRAKTASSAMYLVGRIFSTGSRVFIGSIPASLIVFGDTSATHLALAVGLMTVLGIAYTLVGGIRSVIWTDVIQAGIYLGTAAFTIWFLLREIPAPTSDIVHALLHPNDAQNVPSKLLLLKLGIGPQGIDFADSWTLLASVTGLFLLALASYGMDQDLVQRMLTCKSPREGARSAILGMLIGIPAVAIFLVIGLLMWIYYQRPDLAGAEHAIRTKEQWIFLTFILHDMPRGVAGLMMAGLFAAGLSTVSSTLNSMSATFVSDFYKPRFAGRDERHFVHIGRLGVIGFGVLLGGFALACITLYDPKTQGLIDFALGVMGFAYAGLLGVFLTALFTKMGSERSAVSALVVGFVVVACLNPTIRLWIAGVVEQYRTGQQPVAWLRESIAFPWSLLAGTIAATIVCMLGTPTGRTLDAVAPSSTGGFEDTSRDHTTRGPRDA